MGPQVQRQLEETLEAAVADGESAAILRAGRMSSPLAFIGFAGAIVAAQPAKSQGGRSKGTSSRDNESSEKRQGIEWALEKAAESLSSAQRAMESAKSSVVEARRRHNEASVHHRAATRQLRDADRDRARANQQLEADLRTRAAAEQNLRAAEREYKSRQTDSTSPFK